MKHRLISYLAAAALTVPHGLGAAEPDNIVTHIESTSANRVIQSPAIGALLLPSPQAPESRETDGDDGDDSRTAEGSSSSSSGSSQSKRVNGYRVQVFSDNNARTAKNEARSKSRNISARFPQYRTYVLYSSPYWRLKVGDFRTKAEADEAAEELRKAFPSYSKEIRVVRDKISLN